MGASLPRKVFGTLKTNVGGWGVTAGATKDMASGGTDIEVSADNSDADLSVKVVATADGGVDSISATKGIDLDGASLSITPTYSLASEDADVVVAYDNGDTNVELTASADSQEVTISQQIDDDNKISPTINRNGDISVEWERSLGDDNSLTATIKPDESIDVEWKDDNWTANINAGLSGTNIEGVSISAKRDVTF